MPSGLKNQSKGNFWQELKRRKVLRATTAYAATSYIIIEVVNNVAQPLHFPDWIATVVVVLLIAGLPIVAAISWVFEIGQEGLKRTLPVNEEDSKQTVTKQSRKLLRVSNFVIASLVIAVLILAYPKFFRNKSLEKLIASGDRISIVILPFQNLTNISTYDIWQDGIKDILMTTLSNSEQLNVKQTDAVNAVVQGSNLTTSSVISPSIIRSINKKLEADLIVQGNILKVDSTLRISAQLISSKTGEVFKSFKAEGSQDLKKMFQLVDSISEEINNTLLISKIQKDISPDFRRVILTGSPDAFSYAVNGLNAFAKADFEASVEMLTRAVTIDTNFTWAKLMLSYAFMMQKNSEQSKKWCLIAYRQRDRMPLQMKALIDICYAVMFLGPDEKIDALNRSLKMDSDQPLIHHMLGCTYFYDLHQPDQAISEFEKSLQIFRKWGSKPWWIYNYTELGKAFHFAGMFRKEDKIYSKALKEFPDDYSPILQQVGIALHDRKFDDADKYAQKIISSNKINVSTKVVWISKLAYTFVDNHLPNKAEEYFNKAVSLDPENPVLLNSYAGFLIDQNYNIEKGLKIIDKALELKPDDWSMLDVKGWGFYKQGMFKVALEILQKAWSLQPDNQKLSQHLEAAKKAVEKSK